MLSRKIYSTAPRIDFMLPLKDISGWTLFLSVHEAIKSNVSQVGLIIDVLNQHNIPLPLGGASVT